MSMKKYGVKFRVKGITGILEQVVQANNANQATDLIKAQYGKDKVQISSCSQGFN